MTHRIRAIAFNMFREAVRDRILYNLVFFALLLVATAPLLGQISAGVQRVLLINLSLSAISIFGTVISIFLGISLVSKEIERRTLYPVLARPVGRGEFIAGKYLGLAGTLLTNTLAMAVGFYVTLWAVMRHVGRADANILIAIYFILLQFLVIIALSLFFSSFSSPVLSALFALCLFVAGNFAEDLRVFAHSVHGPQSWLALAASYIIPNLASLNVITRVAHDQSISAALVGYNTLYCVLYSVTTLCGAALIFSRRNLK
ncbi:MAG TPA: ABC transporter permease subunit [Terriglobales bacterium]|nr:ABC transporter permease subunit [Terriglobales bacterium]